MNGQTVFLTGATGILGSWLLKGALDRGYTPYVLLRDATEARARERLRAVLAILDRDEAADRVHIVHGDLTAPGLGLAPAQRAMLAATADRVIHCAANTSFDPRRDDEVWRSNVDATRSMLEFAEAADAPLTHVSTAYVAGTRDGVVMEDELNLGQSFKNTYERSKCAAEGLVRQAIADGRVCGAIVRPSIITGSARNYRISQFLNFYGFLRLVDALSRGSLDVGSVVRLSGAPNVTKNLAPVDWIAEAVWRIMEREGTSGKTYHLTNPAPPSQEVLMNWANTYLADHDAFTRLAVGTPADGTLSPTEEFVRDRLRHYAPYLTHEARYDRRNTDAVLGADLPFPALDADYYSRLLYYAAARRWMDAFETRHELTMKPVRGEPTRLETSAPV